MMHSCETRFSIGRVRRGAAGPGVLAVTFVMAFFAARLTADAKPPAVVGTVEALESRGTLGPYTPAARAGGIAWTDSIHVEGARLLKLHFSNFELAKDDYVILRDQDGTERQVFDSTAKGDFWAVGVIGDTVTIELVSNNAAGGPGFDITDVGVGAALDPVCFACGCDVECTAAAPSVNFPPPDDFVPAPRYPDRTPICAIIYPVKGELYQCSGWVVGHPNRVITSKHCDPGNWLVADAYFNSEGMVCDGAPLKPTTVYQVKGELGSSPPLPAGGLDFSLLEVAPPVPGAPLPATVFGVAPVRGALVGAADETYVFNHSSGCQKQYVEGAVIRIRANTFDSSECTSGGASGSPVMDGAGQVIGLLAEKSGIFPPAGCLGVPPRPDPNCSWSEHIKMTAIWANAPFRAGLPAVECDGAESGGLDPLRYAYPVTDPFGNMTDFWIGTDDPNPGNYGAWRVPLGWAVPVIIADPFPIDHDPEKTPHGVVSPNRGWTFDWVIHFSDGGAGGGLPGGMFTFGFDHAWESHDVGWRTQRGGVVTAEDWSYPVGLGTGPVHAPWDGVVDIIPPAVRCDGLDSGGSGMHSGLVPPLPARLDYTYPVSDPNRNLTDLYIGTDDSLGIRYTNWSEPPGWEHAIIPDTFLPPIDHNPEKTAHGLVSPNPGLNVPWVIHFTDAGVGGGLPAGAFTFGFDHPMQSHDVGWRASNGIGVTAEDWEKPVGMGAGPVHGPTLRPSVECDGLESGGTGVHPCPVPPFPAALRYTYPVSDPNGNLTHLYIATDDNDPGAVRYADWCEPPGWTHAIIADPFPPTFDHGPNKTAHAVVSLNRGLKGRWVIHFWDIAGGGGLAGGTFTFGFNHPWESHDVGWRTDDGNGLTAENWRKPVGGGAGPVHAPFLLSSHPICPNGICEPGEYPANCPEDCPVPAVSEWGLIVITLLAMTLGTIMLARRRGVTTPT